ncbi:Lipase (class 3) [Ceratobasidium sp. AG-Ba]|nr:Lipase (class 3) [Ceratobasidium sp. AG-Ba]QRW15368.1 Lipase (class 3) [Ceratobasidium sp. AG-Ba]
MITTRSLLALFLSVTLSSVALDAETFTLRHVHSSHVDTGRIRWANVPDDIVSASLLAEPTLDGSSTHTHTLQTRRTTIHRPISQEAFHAARQRRKEKSLFGRLALGKEWGQSLGWDEDDVEGPAVDKRETILVLAKMTNNAYLQPTESGWYDLGGNWTADHNIGWEPEDDGFRGHVFLSSDNKTAVLSIKGTSAGWLGGGGPTVRKDKLNDNLLFSCCCAHVDWTWSTVCGCFGGGNKCDEDCVEDALTDESLFYPVGINLYNNITFMYPEAKIWVIGHSLGGALASLIGTTFGAPTVAFEAPGEKMAAQRLHLPMPLHWSADIRTHGIVVVIEQILSADWSDKTGKTKKGWWGHRKAEGTVWESDSESRFLLDEDEGERIEVPAPKTEEDCVECYAWEFGDYMNDTLRKQ